MTATRPPRSLISLSASSASAADDARRIRYCSPYRRRRSRAMARETDGSSSTVRIAGGPMCQTSASRVRSGQQVGVLGMTVQISGDEGAGDHDGRGPGTGVVERGRGEPPGQATAGEGLFDLGVHQLDRAAVAAVVQDAGDLPAEQDLVALPFEAVHDDGL